MTLMHVVTRSQINSKVDLNGIFKLIEHYTNYVYATNNKNTA